ncbi:protein NRT1/ PTR FAMILY 1.2-like [Tripterygium wilfordii]|uniref:protein NRT1/ PTR FAMILY 1.2-like n=1 Tax=Tripterygium wilfordii TaxID=458696 RepID=UPI0018F7FD2B|nr:protein NRT1/ PTR FAMILY 1.2-like [Tripterygium wilfordii]
MGEPNSDQREMNPQQTTKRPKGGLVTMPFIIANEAFEKVSSYGLMPNMILYLMRDYRVSVAKGTNILFFWSAATNFLPLLGAFVSDSYLGRFLTIALGSIASFSGTVLLWSTTMVPHVKPPPCNQSTNVCESPTTGQMTFLISSFVLISIGAGGIRPCSLAFGADQLHDKVRSGDKRVLESFFGWYYASSSVAVLIALTGIVYIQEHLGWKVGFGVPAIIMFFSALVFFLASPLYIKRKGKQSLFTGFVQVVVASYKNRKLPFPPLNSKGGYHQKKDSNLVAPTDKLRFLNKSCIISNPEQDLAPDGSASNPWQLCTIEQVEELKALIKVIPLWSTGVLMSINISQSSFPLLQANSMNRHVTSGFQIPAGSFGMFTIITLTIWILLYDRVILPVASKIKGKPVILGVKLRMGIGIFFSFLSMAVSAIVESIRRRRAIREGFANNPQAVLMDMNAMWLAPQHCLNGLAEAFNAIGQTEFYYSEFPRSMSSIASALFGLGMAVANLLASVILSSMDHITSKGGKESWVSSNINKGHYDNYYWVLAILSFINLLYFVVCSWWYGPCAEQYTNLEEGDQEELTELDKSHA